MNPYWKLGLWAIQAAIIGFIVWHFTVLQDAKSQESALAAQAAELAKRCEIKMKSTKEANDELQKNIGTISAKLDTAKRMHPSVCVPVVSKLAQPSTGGAEHAGQNGIETDWLRDFAAECETYRSEVVILNKFGLDERKNP